MATAFIWMMGSSAMARQDAMLWDRVSLGVSFNQLSPKRINYPLALQCSNSVSRPAVRRTQQPLCWYAHAFQASFVPSWQNSDCSFLIRAECMWHSDCGSMEYCDTNTNQCVGKYGNMFHFHLNCVQWRLVAILVRVECFYDYHCNDHLWCTGHETCVNGQCQRDPGK